MHQLMAKHEKAIWIWNQKEKAVLLESLLQMSTLTVSSAKIMKCDLCWGNVVNLALSLQVIKSPLRLPKTLRVICTYLCSGVEFPHII